MAAHDFISPEEAYLFNNGELQRSYGKFGAQVLEDGVHFAVWAPHATCVSVVGDFNQWQGAHHAMQLLGAGQTGIWTLFIPKLKAGERYKYEITAKDGTVVLKADPFAFLSELRPNTASVTYNMEGYQWSEAAQAWDAKKHETREQDENRPGPSAKPILIYEVHFGSWRRHPDDSLYTYRELADTLISYVKDMGYTHIEVMPLMEHPLDASWGYQITGYYSATSRFGTPHDLMYFVDKCHQAGIGVIMDWVPGHFCRDTQGLGRFDGEPLYDGGDHANWGTYRVNFARAEVWSFFISNALFWLDKFRFDGLRVDGVTSMLYSNFGEANSDNKSHVDERAVAFLQSLNDVVHSAYPNSLMFAEESSEWPCVTHPTGEGGLGFNYKWNMGWMNDTLKYMERPFSDRGKYHDCLTFSLMYAHSENFILPFSHDEVVHGKKSLLGRMPGDYWQQFAGLRALYCYYLTHPGKKICFMGTELAPFIEWRYYEELEWFMLNYEPHQQIQHFVKEANKIYQTQEALWFNDSGWQGFDWIDADNREQSIFTFLRYGSHEDDHLLVVLNMTPAHYSNYKVGVPIKAEPAKGGAGNDNEWLPTHNYEPLLNSDEARFGGSGKGNANTVSVELAQWHNRPASITIDIPPLAGLIFKPVRRK
ncbi:MAG: 1,4-alpha-glucan branching protein GlgB [Coriobacteriia bacterium]|nr:1,4-alpha-glucan branching protein GlgB [Coriobacteriia bacterium]